MVCETGCGGCVRAGVGFRRRLHCSDPDLTAQGKDAVAKKVLQPAVQAVLDGVRARVPGADKVLSAWVVDTAYDAAQGAISSLCERV